MKTDNRYKPMCLRCLSSKTYYNFEEAPVEELTAIIDFINLLKDYKNNYDEIPIGRLAQLFIKEN